MKGENLKKELKGLEKNELISLLLEVAALRKENLEWLSLKLQGTKGDRQHFRTERSGCTESKAGEERLR